MDEQRRYPRFDLNIPLQIDTAEKSDRLGVTHNLSASGALFATRSRFALGQALELRFRPNPDAPERRVRGRVVRLRDTWNNFFPRRVAVAFEPGLDDIATLLQAAVS